MNTTCRTRSLNSSNCSGRLSRALGSRKPYSTSVPIRDMSPSYIPWSWGTVTYGMYEGDMSRKGTLVEYGFRLPSALDNRPLRFGEFTQRVQQVVLMSATPSP